MAFKKARAKAAEVVKDAKSAASTKGKQAIQSGGHAASEVKKSAIGKATAVRNKAEDVKRSAGKVKKRIHRKKNERKRLDAAADAWVADFNREMGWATLDNAPDDTRPAYLRPPTPLDLFAWQAEDVQTDIAGREADIAIEELALDQARNILDQMPDDDDGRDDYEQRVDQMADEIAEAKAAVVSLRIDKMARIQAKHDQMAAGDAELVDERDRLEDLIASAREATDDNAAITDAFRARRATFQIAHGNAADTLARLKDETFPIADSVGDGAAIVHLKVLDPTRYRVLAGMLELAMVQFLSGAGKSSNAQEAAEAAARETLISFTKKRIDYISDRTGALPPKAPSGGGGLGPRTENGLRRIETVVRALKGSPFDEAAQDIDAARCANAVRVRAATNFSPAEIDDHYADAIETLAARAEDDRRLSALILAEFDKASSAIEILRMNGDVQDADLETQDLERFRIGQDLADALQRAKVFADSVTKLAKDRRDAKVSPKSIEDVKKDLKALDGRIEAFFSHNPITKNRRSTTDSGTGETTDRRALKYLDAPHEALEELELRLTMARQLAESGSVEASAAAASEIADLATFLDHVEQKPEAFKLVKKMIETREKRMARVDKKYAAFMIVERKRFAAELETIKKSYLTADPMDTRDKLREWSKRGNDMLAIAQDLKANDKALKARAKDAQKKVRNIGSKLAKYGEHAGVTLTGDHSSHQADLQRIGELIAGCSDASQTAAAKALVALEPELIKVDDLLTRALRAVSGSRDAELDSAQMRELVDFLDDAKAGQLDHDRDQEAKPAFQDRLRALAGQLQLQKKPLAYLKADPSELNALIQQVKALGSEIKASGAYVDGLERLDGYQNRADGIANDIEAARRMVDYDLEQAATELVDRANAFSAYVDNFYARSIGPLDADGELANGPGDKIQDYLTSLSRAIPTDTLNALPAQMKVLASRGEDPGARKKSRAEVLRGIRRLMAVFEGFPPMEHFSRQPFDSGAKHIAGLRAALPRLEVKVLTAI